MTATEDFARFHEDRNRERAERDAAYISWREAELPGQEPSEPNGYVARNGETRAYVRRRRGAGGYGWEVGRLIGRELDPRDWTKNLSDAERKAKALVRAELETKEDGMATATRKKTTRSSARSTAPAPETAETPKQIHAALVAAIKKAVPGKVEATSNATNRYLTFSKAEKSFGLVFAAGARTVSVKILPRTKTTAADLPKDHGFKESKYGLMRSVSSLADVEVVAKSFAIAAEKGA